ncbi:MAG: hypothetical protein Q9191_003477, partial [Dirinaria sp. TL-2023a]
MAPSSGHLLVPKAMKIFKYALSKVRSKIPQSSSAATSSTARTANYALQPIRISNEPYSSHPLSRTRQSGAQRWLHTVRNNISSAKARPYDGSSFNSTKAAKCIRQRGAVPFASTLRPNLTCGTLPRNTLGVARHFSSGTTCQAQVIHNVNAGIRTLLVGGGKARFDGVDPTTGNKRFKTVTKTQEKALKRFDNCKAASAKGTSLEFRLSPTITTLLPSLGFEQRPSLDNNVLNALSTDFAHAVNDLTLTLTDLKRLSALGNFPLSLISTPKGPALSIRFPGCDAETVSNLCEELGIVRGIVREDEDWKESKEVEMALLFPFAPAGHPGSNSINDYEQDGMEYFERKPQQQQQKTVVDTIIAPEQVEWQGMMTPSTTTTTTTTDLCTPSSTATFDRITHPVLTPAYETPSPSGYESMHTSEYNEEEDPQIRHQYLPQSTTSSTDYEGVQGIYRFLQECDAAR